MLKFGVHRETSSLGQAGDMHSIVVDAGSIPGLISIVEPDSTKPGEPPDPWRGYVLRLNCSVWAASLLHALELTVAEAARWIAVELLKHPAPPSRKKKAAGVAGTTLWLVRAAKESRSLRLHSTHAAGGEHLVLGHTMGGPLLYGAKGLAQEHSHVCPCASEEQALAWIVEQAAPWIAVALVKEIGT